MSRFLKGTECPEGLICFPKLKTGQVDLEGKERPTTLVLAWPKAGNDAWLAKLKGIVDAARVERFGPQQKVKSPIKDADTYETEQGDIFAEKHPELAGHFFINLQSRKPFALVGANPKDVLNPEDVESGDIGRCAIHAYAWEYQSKKGVSFGHGNIQRLRAGDVKIGGGGAASPDDDFGDDVSAKAAKSAADLAVTDDAGWETE